MVSRSPRHSVRHVAHLLGDWLADFPWQDLQDQRRRIICQRAGAEEARQRRQQDEERKEGKQRRERDMTRDCPAVMQVHAVVGEIENRKESADRVQGHSSPAPQMGHVRAHRKLDIA